MIKPITLALSVSLATCFSAQAMNVEYASFYSHVKKLKGEETEALQFAFGFLHNRTKQLCKIKSAKIHTQKKDITLDVTSEQRFTVPSEKALKLAKAVVQIEVEEPENQCDMSVQLETRSNYLKQSYTAEDLNYLFHQYENFFDEMGGFLSFMMPNAQGIVLQFDHQKSLPEIRSGATLPGFQGHSLILDKTRLKDFSGTLDLSSAPVRITAYLPK